MYCATAAAGAHFACEEFADGENFDSTDVPAFSYEHGGDAMSVDQVRCGRSSAFAAVLNDLYVSTESVHIFCRAGLRVLRPKVHRPVHARGLQRFG
jgi:hypothetical protein|eukprot:COSAG03_NODE_902_length_5420_cov_2.668859_7_plen_96_part_00